MIKFSVVIPLYNKEEEIVDTLNSVFTQTYQANEVIVVDDGSTDRSREFVEKYFPQVKIISQRNLGVSSARNRGIEEAKNEHIAILDGDDLWERDFLSEIKLLIEEYPNAIFYSTATKSIDENGGMIPNKIPSYLVDRTLIGNFPKVFAKNYGIINASSTCIRKSIIKKNHLEFPEKEKKGEDICFWIELSLLGDFSFSTKPLSIYKLDASNRSGTVHKEAIIPCPIKWFYQNRERLKKHKLYKNIRYLVYSNLLITVYGGFGLSKNYISIDAVVKLMKKRNDFLYLLSYPAYFIPISLLEFIKKIRRKFRG